MKGEWGANLECVCVCVTKSQRVIQLQYFLLEYVVIVCCGPRGDAVSCCGGVCSEVVGEGVGGGGGGWDGMGWDGMG